MRYSLAIATTLETSSVDLGETTKSAIGNSSFFDSKYLLIQDQSLACSILFALSCVTWSWPTIAPSSLAI